MAVQLVNLVNQMNPMKLVEFKENVEQVNKVKIVNQVKTWMPLALVNKGLYAFGKLDLLGTFIIRYYQLLIHWHLVTQHFINGDNQLVSMNLKLDSFFHELPFKFLSNKTPLQYCLMQAKLRIHDVSNDPTLWNC